MSMGIGINGFGRIGRLVFRILMDKGLRVTAINDPALNAKYAAYQLKYDSIHGTYDGSLSATEDVLRVNDKEIKIFHEKEPDKVPWPQVKAEYIVESSGVFTTVEKAGKHNARHVLITAPSKDAPTYVVGVNSHQYETREKVVSMASCTTNCLAPMAKVINDNFTIKYGLMTTIHSATLSQSVLDGSSKKDWRLGRSTLGNLIPSSTGAAKALALVIPSLKGKVTGMAFRVPTPNVSVVDFTVLLEKPGSYDEIKCLMKEASEGKLKGVLGYTEEQLVSTDIIGTSHSSIFDAQAGISLNPHFVKLVSWYDNEYGYSSRVVDFLLQMMELEQTELMGKNNCNH